MSDCKRGRKLTATELLDALVRLRDVRNVGVGQIVIDVPAGRERALARDGLVAKAQALRRMNAKRCDATLLDARRTSGRIASLTANERVRPPAVISRRLEPPRS